MAMTTEFEKAGIEVARSVAREILEHGPQRFYGVVWEGEDGEDCRIISETTSVPMLLWPGFPMSARFMDEHLDDWGSVLADWHESDVVYLAQRHDELPGRPCEVDFAMADREAAGELAQVLGGGRVRTRSEMIDRIPDMLLGVALRRWDAGETLAETRAGQLAWARTVKSSIPSRKAASAWGLTEPSPGGARPD